MDTGKVTALIAWINSLKAGDENIRKLEELKDGKLLLNILKLANKDGKPLPDCSTAMDRFCRVEEFLEAYYMTTIVSKVNFEEIMEKGCEFEIGKCVMLLLGAAIQYHNSESFMTAAMSIPVEYHYEIKEMMEPLLMKDQDNNAPVIPKYFGTILKTRLSKSDVDSCVTLSTVATPKKKKSKSFL
ncbi:uncharacterized protein LOC141905305 [Tubulanus polymorphus]|uniref:uncharacterized protein LOC141905305 n=1 Tax=Tubulanus polymorphus TaxID=672921 RepID=UPI003DA2C0D3